MGSKGLHQLSPDVWAHTGGTLVLLGHGGRETMSRYVGKLFGVFPPV